MEYPLTRQARWHCARREPGYLFVRYDDRVDVYKHAMGEATTDAIVAALEPTYRVTAGACTCEGYLYRSSCRHVNRVKDWDAS